MKQLIAILLLALFTLQAIPVMRLLAAAKDIASFTVLDEDKQDDEKSKEKKDIKEYLTAPAATLQRDSQSIPYHTPLIHSLPSPYLESFTPPPDFTC